MLRLGFTSRLNVRSCITKVMADGKTYKTLMVAVVNAESLLVSCRVQGMFSFGRCRGRAWASPVPQSFSNMVYCYVCIAFSASFSQHFKFVAITQCLLYLVCPVLAFSLESTITRRLSVTNPISCPQTQTVERLFDAVSCG